MHDVLIGYKLDAQPYKSDLKTTIFDPDSSVDDVLFPKFDVLDYLQKKSLSEFDFQKGYLSNINRLTVSRKNLNYNPSIFEIKRA